MAEQGRITLFMSPLMLEELTEVLGYARFEARLERLGLTQADLITHVLGLVTMIDHPASRVRVVLEDPDDDMFLHCAANAKAQAIVSGDAHLLSLGCYESIPIMSVRDFLDFLGNSDAPPESPTG